MHAVARRPSRRRKIRVLLEVHPVVVGGLGRFLQDLVGHLDRNRFEPILFASRDGIPLRAFESSGVRVEAIDCRENPRGLVRFLQEARVDVAQSNCLSFGLALAARAARVPHVWCLTGHFDLAADCLRGDRLGLTLQSILRLSSRVVCVTRSLRSQFDGIGRRGEVDVLYSGVDLDRIDAEAGLPPPTAQTSPPRVGMIARIQPQKRQLDFVRAARRVSDVFPEAEFYLFGGTNPEKESREYSRSLARELRRLGLERRFIVKECLEGRFKEYRSMTAIVLPSLQEGGSIALLEAMALGKPVVAARSGGNVEFVRENSTGLLVPPRQPRALADAVIRLLSDRGLARRLGREGRRRVERRFNILDSVRRYESVWLAAVRRGLPGCAGVS